MDRLKRVLSLRDLVLFNFVSVSSITAIASSAKVGVSGLTLFVLAAVLFFIPEGLAVTALSTAYPEEGGIYPWTRRLLGKGHGFFCGWCYYVNNILYMPGIILSAAVIATYMFPGSKPGNGFVIAFTLGGLWFATLINLVGIQRGRWLQNLGGIGTYVPFLLLVAAGIHGWMTQAPANSFRAPNWSIHWNNFAYLNLWALVPFAYAGLELPSTMGGETKNPTRTLPRSVYIAAPCIALFYIVGTGSLLYLVPKTQVDAIGGCFVAIGGWHALPWLVGVAAGCAALGRIGGLGAWLSGSSRVALVVGLDRYFPASFARIHPRWGTPYVAMLVQTILATAFLLMATVGKGTTLETAFLTLLDMSIVLYFIPYAYLFICFLAERRGLGSRVAGIAGLTTTLFGMFVAMIPPPGSDPIGFEVKVIGGCALLLLLGLLFYRRGSRKT